MLFGLAIFFFSFGDNFRSNDKTNLFVNEAQFPAIVEHKSSIKDIRKEIDEYRKTIQQILKVPSFTYSTVSGVEVSSRNK